MTAFQCAFPHCFTTNVTATATAASFIPSSPLHFFTVSAIPPCLCDTFPKFGDLFSHREVTGVRCTGGLLLLLLRVFTRVCRVAQPSGQWELHNGEFFKFFDSSCYFWAGFAISLWFSTNISYFLQLWCCLCGWLGRQLVHALGFLFLFGMLCMLDFCRHFCSYFFANHFFIKLNLLRVINTEISHACCSLCW